MIAAPPAPRPPEAWTAQQCSAPGRGPLASPELAAGPAQHPPLLQTTLSQGGRTVLAAGGTFQKGWPGSSAQLRRVAGLLSSRRETRPLNSSDAPACGAHLSSVAAQLTRLHEEHPWGPSEQSLCTGGAHGGVHSDWVTPGKGGGGWCRMLCTRSLCRAAAKGGCPAAHSYSRQPSAQRSLALLCCPAPLNSSGAMYAGVALCACASQPCSI